MLGEFLKLFGNPLVKALEDVKGIKKEKWDNFNWSLRYEIPVLQEVNRLRPYWLFFTPNWNYWDVSIPWQKCECKSNNPWHNPHRNCLFADIDRNNKKNPTGLETNEELRLEILDTIKKHSICPSLVVETPGWWHLYWMIHPDDRELIHHTMWKDMVKIITHITKLFHWWDDSSLSINKVMRIPYSNHWKTKDPLAVKLFFFDKDTFELVPMEKEHFDKIQYRRTEELEIFLQHVKNNKVVEHVKMTQQQFYSSEAYNTANSIPFPVLLEKLESRPKLYKGKKYVFWISGTTLTVAIDWVSDPTSNWYKRERSSNYVNCFSDQNHPIDERPRGNVMSFLHYYFSKDASVIKSFLKNEFMITVDDAPLEDEEELLVVTKHDYSVIFTSRRVRLKSVAMSKTGQYERLVDIFKLPLKIIGKWKTKMTYNAAETEDMNDVFLCESGINKFFLRRHVSKKEFNNKNQHLFFYWEDNDLWMFYEALIFDDKIDSVDILSQSWIYEDCVYVWGNVIYGETEKFLFPSFEFDMSWKTKEQVTVKDFLDWLTQITADYIAIPAVLQTIVLAGMNIRWEKTIYPGMLLTWWTWSGKTVLSFMLKSMVGYTNTSRTYSLWSLSPQPLKQYATDHSILFLEEITSNIQERCEEILRNVLNHNKGWRWTSTWSNVFYDFRAPIFALWERTFKDESINNRFLTIVMSSTQHKGDDGKIAARQDVTCIDDIYWRYYSCQDKLSDKYEEYADRLKQDWVHPRVADVRAYSYAVNDLFGLGYTYDELFWFMKINLKNIGYDMDSTIKIGKEHHLKSIIVNWIMSRKVMWTYENHDKYDSYTIMFMEDYYQKNRATLNFMINEFNKEKDRMVMVWNDLVVRVATTWADKEDFVLDKIFNFILKVWKHAFTSIYS